MRNTKLNSHKYGECPFGVFLVHQILIPFPSINDFKLLLISPDF